MIEPSSELTPYRGRSRARSRVSVTPGVHRLRDSATPELAELHAWQTLLPRRGGFTGVTAARLHGWWLPPLPDSPPVFAAVGPGEGHAERRGLVVHRLASTPELTLRSDGLRVTTPAETLLACARWLGVLDLVVLADAALRGGTPLPVLREAARANRSGVVRLRAALDAADPGSESAWETVLRMLHVACGVPVCSQHPVIMDGGAIARGDLWIVDTRVLHEYDGGHHREPAQFARDLARTRSLQRAGWLRSGYTAADLLQRPQFVLADADRALGRPHLPDRIGPWTDLLHGSTLTPSVRRRLGTAWARAARGRGGPPAGTILRNRGTS